MQKIFPTDLFEFSELAQTILKSRFNDLFDLSENEIIKAKSIILRPEYQWRIETDEYGVKVLVPYENGDMVDLEKLVEFVTAATDKKLKLRGGGQFKRKGFEIFKGPDFKWIIFELNSHKHIAFVRKSVNVEDGFKVFDYYPLDRWLSS